MRYDAKAYKEFPPTVWLRRWELVKLFFGMKLTDTDWDTKDIIVLRLFRRGPMGQAGATPWRIQVSHDLRAYHSLDAEEKLTEILSKHLQSET